MIKEIFNTAPSYYERINLSLNPDNIKQMALESLMGTYALQKAICKAEYNEQTFENISNKMDHNINNLLYVLIYVMFKPLSKL